MEDVITEAGPPSRFLEEDLNIFTPPSPSPSPPLPSPFLLFPLNHSLQPLTPSLLIISLSASSLSLFCHLPNQTLIASLILPELPLSLHAPATLHSLSPSTLLFSLPSPLSPHRAHAVAKTLLSGDHIRPQSVLVLDAVDPRNYRGRLSSDETVAFKLETSAERKRNNEDKLLDDSFEYYPSGSVVDGFAAAVLARCQLLNVRASLCVSWPQFDESVVQFLKDLLQRRVLRGFQFDFGLGGDDEVSKIGRSKERRLQSELYI